MQLLARLLGYQYQDKGINFLKMCILSDVKYIDNAGKDF
jgi:hypothetical protein